MNKNIDKFIQENSLDGGFLQSEFWRNFQENTGKKTHQIFSDYFWANIIEHNLPLVGKYFYVPRGPVFSLKNESEKKDAEKKFLELIDLAKKENVSWIRADIESQEKLNFIKNIQGIKIKKAPHDVQPKQIFIIDIEKSEEEILAGMKSKTRYNIRLAQKKNVVIESVGRDDEKAKDFLKEFLRLTDVMAKRSGITAHPKEYYEKMFENISADNLRIFTGKFEGKIIAAALVFFYGGTATYLHGASDDEFRNVMAPFLLQWEAIREAKKRGCKKYDFGGTKTFVDESGELQIEKSSWEGITRFKLGFSTSARPLTFAGTYDIVIRTHKYGFYEFLGRIKKLLVILKKI